MAGGTQPNVGEKLSGIGSYWIVRFRGGLGKETQTEVFSNTCHGSGEHSPDFSFAIVHIFHFDSLKWDFIASVPLYQLKALLRFLRLKGALEACALHSRANGLFSRSNLFSQVSRINLIHNPLLVTLDHLAKLTNSPESIMLNYVFKYSLKIVKGESQRLSFLLIQKCTNQPTFLDLSFLLNYFFCINSNATLCL